MEKKKEEYAYEFQEFIAINKINVKKLPKLLRRMIKNINKIEAKAKTDCTPSHYKLVKNQISPFANDVIDELYEIFDKKLKNNQFEQVQDNEEKHSFEKALNEYFDQYDTDTISSLELIELGINLEAVGSNRFIYSGQVQLKRLFASDLWQLQYRKEALR